MSGGRLPRHLTSNVLENVLFLFGALLKYLLVVSLCSPLMIASRTGSCRILSLIPVVNCKCSFILKYPYDWKLYVPAALCKGCNCIYIMTRTLSYRAFRAAWEIVVDVLYTLFPFLFDFSVVVTLQPLSAHCISHDQQVLQNRCKNN